MKATRASIQAGLAHLCQADPILRQVIEGVGPFQLRLERDRFLSLVRAIVAQQISGGAARSIFQRLQALTLPGPMTAESLSLLSAEKMRTAGVSPQKAGYLLDLASKVRDQQVHLHRMGRMNDEEVISELIQIRGIGVWTAQMFLIFSLGRMDVFPHDDLGIRAALRNLYGLKELPNRETSCRIAQCWRPYATLASWYCWRSLDKPKEPLKQKRAASSRP